MVHKPTIGGYTGEGSPPHIEMMIIADSDKITPPSLTVEAKLNGVSEPNIIKFEKEAQSVFNTIVCQVFYHREALNHWRATVTFFPKQHLEVCVFIKLAVAIAFTKVGDVHCMHAWHIASILITSQIYHYTIKISETSSLVN